MFSGLSAPAAPACEPVCRSKPQLSEGSEFFKDFFKILNKIHQKIWYTNSYLILIFGHRQYQVKAQPGFQTQLCLQQVQVLSGYSTFWTENYFTW